MSPASPSLKSQVPIRTWSEWQGVRPGSLQADLALHCGESTQGFYLTTLTAVDIASAWTEVQVVWGMGRERVGGAIHHVRKLIAKQRQGAKLVKRYDRPMTPYQRRLSSDALDKVAPQALAQQLLSLNPAQLQRRIDLALRRLWSTATNRQQNARKVG